MCLTDELDEETLDPRDPPDLTPLLVPPPEAEAVAAAEPPADVEDPDGPPRIPFIFWWLAQASQRGWVPPSRLMVPASRARQGYLKPSTMSGCCWPLLLPRPPGSRVDIPPRCRRKHVQVRQGVCFVQAH